MRYRLLGNLTVKSENAAKPAAQQSKYLAEILDNLPPVERTFDYGCGKLRYLIPMRRSTEDLALVDSEVQLSRDQRLFGVRTSIRALAGPANDVIVLNNSEFNTLRMQFDRGFCINTLSAVPIPLIRRRIVQLIARKLKPGGLCLFVAQYRNSDFKRMARQPNAKRYEDGIVLDSLRGYSFYAILRPEKLAKLVEEGGMSVADLYLNEGSAFVWGQNEGVVE